MAPPNSTSQSSQNYVISASGQPGEHATVLSNSSVPTSAPPRSITPKPKSPLDPICTHETAFGNTNSCSCKPALPIVDTLALPSPSLETTSPWLVFGRYRGASIRAAPIGRLDETTVTVEVELSSEAAKKAEKSFWWTGRH